MINAADILEYWFTAPVNQHWFSATPALDRQIRQRFESLWLEAVEGTLDGWQGTAEGALALVILFDQFPLNMYRGEARSFSTEERAREVARSAIDNRLDQQLSAQQKAFLYMPFMHSESLADQDYSVQLFAQAQLEDNLGFARHHREIIQRFGRFPHRNLILRRQSSVSELEYLASEQAFKG